MLHPYGVTRVDGAAGLRVVLAGTHRAGGRLTSWAWGSVAADQPTPQVWFTSRTGLRRAAARTRRLTSRLWAAEVSGAWPCVRVC